MAVTIIKPPMLIDATDDTSDGVQTVSFTWAFQTSISATLTDNLPHVVKTLSGLNLAVEGTPAPGLPLCTCRKTACKRGEKNGLYLFTATYSDKAVDRNAASPVPAYNENPLNDPPVVVPTASIKQFAYHKDRDGNALLNTARDPILATKDSNTISYTVKCNVAVDFADTTLDPYLDTCNDAAIQIKDRVVSANAARFILPAGFLSEPKARNGTAYRELTFEIWIDERDKHYGVPMNAGFRELVEELDDEGASFDPPQYVHRTILSDGDGSETTEAVPLEEDGTKMVDPQPETVLYLEQKLYPEIDYTDLPGVIASA